MFWLDMVLDDLKLTGWPEPPEGGCKGQVCTALECLCVDIVSTAGKPSRCNFENDDLLNVAPSVLLGPAARWQNARGRLHQKRHQLAALKQNSYRIPVLAAIPLLQNGLEEKAWKGVVDHWDIRVNVHPIGREV